MRYEFYAVCHAGQCGFVFLYTCGESGVPCFDPDRTDPCDRGNLLRDYPSGGQEQQHSGEDHFRAGHVAAASDDKRA